HDPLPCVMVPTRCCTPPPPYSQRPRKWLDSSGGGQLIHLRTAGAARTCTQSRSRSARPSSRWGSDRIGIQSETLPVWLLPLPRPQAAAETLLTDRPSPSSSTMYPTLIEAVPWQRPEDRCDLGGSAR